MNRSGRLSLVGYSSSVDNQDDVAEDLAISGRDMARRLSMAYRDEADKGFTVFHCHLDRRPGYRTRPIRVL